MSVDESCFGQRAFFFVRLLIVCLVRIIWLDDVSSCWAGDELVIC